MATEFKMKFNMERLIADNGFDLCLSEFLCGLFDELGYPDMTIRVTESTEDQQLLFAAKWNAQ